jgi:hypothetical protein
VCCRPYLCAVGESWLRVCGPRHGTLPLYGQRALNKLVASINTHSVPTGGLPQLNAAGCPPFSHLPSHTYERNVITSLGGGQPAAEEPDSKLKGRQVCLSLRADLEGKETLVFIAVGMVWRLYHAFDCSSGSRTSPPPRFHKLTPSAPYPIKSILHNSVLHNRLRKVITIN